MYSFNTTPLSGHKAKVNVDYPASAVNELTLRVGDVVTIISEESEGWWKADLNGRQGMMPSNFAILFDGKFLLDFLFVVHE